jgi:hypothetical protein
VHGVVGVLKRISIAPLSMRGQRSPGRKPPILIKRLIALAVLGGAEILRVAPPVGAALPDVSGMAWMGGDLFVAVHDRKQGGDRERPHISLLRLPAAKGSLEREAVAVRWPGSQGEGHDLESVARIPDRQKLLLVESGDDGGPIRRIFYARLGTQGMELVSSLPWPHRVRNVEGSAVARVNNRLIFLYAERAHGHATTRLRWADLQLEPLRLGSFREMPLTSPGPEGPHRRPVTALEVDRAGQIYVASAIDPGNDDGPFRSMVWRVGRIQVDSANKLQLILDQKPKLLAQLDKHKVEALAIRETQTDEPELVVGVDNENLGGKIRRLQLSARRDPAS